MQTARVLIPADASEHLLPPVVTILSTPTKPATGQLLASIPVKISVLLAEYLAVIPPATISIPVAAKPLPPLLAETVLKKEMKFATGLMLEPSPAWILDFLLAMSNAIRRVPATTPPTASLATRVLLAVTISKKAPKLVMEPHWVDKLAKA